MRRLLSVLFLAPLLAVPASAAECTTTVTRLCDAANDAGLDALFGDYADIGALVLGLFLVIFLIVAVVWLFRRPSARPRLTVTMKDQLRETVPGGSVQLVCEVENRRKRTGTDVTADWGQLPAGWTAAAFAALHLPSGFSAPQIVGPDQPLRLSSGKKGANKATLAVQVKAPMDASERDTFDVRVKVVPRTRGRPRPRRGKNLEYTVFVTSGRPVLQIKNVSHDPPRIESGHLVRTRATLSNGGEAEAREVGVSFLLNDQTVARKVLPVVPAHEETSVEFEWVPSTGENRIRIAIA